MNVHTDYKRCIHKAQGHLVNVRSLVVNEMCIVFIDNFEI